MRDWTAIEQVLPQGLDHSRPPFFRRLVIAAALLVCAYAYVGYIVAHYGGLTAELGWEASADEGSWRVSRVSPAGPADGRLRPGDVVLAINGRAEAGRLGPFYDFSGYESGLRFVRIDAAATPYIVRVSRDGGEIDVSLKPLVRYGPRDLATTLSLIATSLSFFFVGTFVGLSRPGDDLPRRLALASLPSAMMLMAIAIQPSSPFLSAGESYPRLVLASVYPFHYLLAYGFFFRVACGSQRPPFWSHLERALWVAGVAVFAMRTTSTFMNVPEFPPVVAFMVRYPEGFQSFSDLTVRFQRLYNPVLTLALCAVLAANYGVITDAAHRRRLKWIAYGTLVGLGPLFVEAILRSLLATAGLNYVVSTAAYQFVYRVATVAPIIVPIVFGYAILRHRLLGVQVVVRRGLQYLLARNMLRVALALPALGLVYTFVSNADKTIADVLLERSPYFYALLFGAGVVSLNYRAQLVNWLDRRFFREAYQQEKILLALVDELNGCESIPDISRLVCERVQRALHPRAVYVFYRDRVRGDFALGHSSSGHAGLQLPEQFASVALLEARSRVLEFRSARATGLPPDEERWFRSLAVTMLIAMKGANGRLCGMMLLGDKLSEEAYSANDTELLQAIAGQAAIVCEHLWLKADMRREQQLKRDVLAHVDRHSINLLKECPRCGACFNRSDQVCAVDGAELELTLPVERLLDRRYRLDRRLGRGAMGIVYEAFDQRLRRPVAVKVLHGALFGAREALRRFEREAQASSRLSHAHVVGTHDFGVVGDDGAYLVLELLRGITWREQLNRTGRLAPSVLGVLLDQVLDGLQAAHDVGLIHRDLKPENLMICDDPDGRAIVKILDFGLAKNVIVESETQLTAPELTAPGMLLGTYTYMSPEQLSGGPIDARSDLFAVGVIAVESLTGTRPFRGKLLTELVRAVLHDPFHLDGDTPQVRRLDACLQKALAKSHEQRYPTAAAMRTELVPAIASCTPWQGPLGAPDDAASATAG